jgi:hypothetical protein
MDDYDAFHALILDAASKSQSLLVGESVSPAQPLETDILRELLWFETVMEWTRGVCAEHHLETYPIGADYSAFEPLITEAGGSLAEAGWSFSSFCVGQRGGVWRSLGLVDAREFNLGRSELELVATGATRVDQVIDTAGAIEFTLDAYYNVGSPFELFERTVRIHTGNDNLLLKVPLVDLLVQTIASRVAGQEFRRRRRGR